MPFQNYRVLTFDTFGTLVDWEAGLLPRLRELAQHSAGGMADEALLALFGELELAQQRATPGMRYRELLAVVYRQIAERLGVGADGAGAFGASVPDWPAFADTPQALARLREHFLLVTLTNCDRQSYRGAHARLGVELDLVLTAQDVGAYKPDLRNFHVLLETLRRRFGVLPREVLHVAQSLTHDHVPATALGLANVWINRRGGGGATVPPGEPYRIDHEYPTLAEFAMAVQREFDA